MNQRSRHLLLKVLLAVQVLLGGIQADVCGADDQPAKSNGDVPGVSQLVYENGKLSVSAEKSNLLHLLKRISELIKIPIEVNYKLASTVTVIFKDLRPEDGVGKILEAAGEKNLMSEYTRNADKGQGDFKIEKIVIVRKGKQRMTKEEEAGYLAAFAKKEEELVAFFKKMDVEHDKISKVLKEYVDPKTDKERKMQIVTFLRQTHAGREDKPVLKAAMLDPQYREIYNHLQMTYLHVIQSSPEESDKDFILDMFLQKRQPVGWFIYAIPEIWDERFVPILLEGIRTKPRNIEAIQMIGRVCSEHKEAKLSLKEAIPLLEDALRDEAPGIGGAAHNALYSLTGKRYEYKYYHKGDELKVE